MNCQRYGTELPDDANYCLKCGMSQRAEVGVLEAPATWEYKELLVPLNLPDVYGGREYVVLKVAQNADAAILPYLQQAAHVGWQADEPADFASLWKRERVQYEQIRLGFAYRIRSASIRLKRQGR